MGMSNAFENDILNLLFKNANAASIGDATGLRGASTAGFLYISLHTADPTDSGLQNSSEANYTSYARVAVVRSASGWTVTGNEAVNAASIVFPVSTGGTVTVTHFGIGTDPAGAGKLLVHGALLASLEITAGIAPEIPAGDLAVTAD